MKKLMMLLVVCLVVFLLALGFRLYDEQKPNEILVATKTVEITTDRQLVYLPVKLSGVVEKSFLLVNKDLPVWFGQDDCLCYANGEAGVLPQCE